MKNAFLTLEEKKSGKYWVEFADIFYKILQ